MVIHGSKASLNRRRMGFTAQYTVPGVKMNRMDYTQTIAFSEDFRFNISKHKDKDKDVRIL